MITSFTTGDSGRVSDFFGCRSLHDVQEGLGRSSWELWPLRGGCCCGRDQKGSVELRHWHAMRYAQQAADKRMSFPSPELRKLSAI